MHGMKIRKKNCTGVRYQSLVTPDMFLTVWLILKCSTHLENFQVFYRIRMIFGN
jgi:hypothetical protein